MQSTDKLFDLIRNKHHVLVQLRDMGRRQAELVNSGEITALLKLLAAKQQMIIGLQALEQELKPYYKEEPDARVWHSPTERVQCAQLAQECNALLEEVVSLEKRVPNRWMPVKTKWPNNCSRPMRPPTSGTHIKPNAAALLK